MARSPELGMMLRLEAKIDTLEKELKKAARAVDREAGTMEGRAKRMVDKIEKDTGSLKLEKFVTGFKDAAGSVPLLGGAMSALAGPAAAATAAMAALAVGVAKAQEAMDWAATATDTANQIGIGVEALQEFRFVADEAGISVQDMEAGLKSLNGTLGAVLTGVGDEKILKAFKAIGISRADLASMKDGTELMRVLADRIKLLGSQAEQVQIAKKLGVEALLPVLQQGSQGIDGMRESARNLGFVINGEVVNSLDELQRKTEKASQRIDTQMKVAFLSLAPAIEGATTALADFLQKWNELREQGRPMLIRAEGKRRGFKGEALDDYVEGVLAGQAYTGGGDGGARGRKGGYTPGQWKKAKIEEEPDDPRLTYRPPAPTAAEAKKVIDAFQFKNPTTGPASSQNSAAWDGIVEYKTLIDKDIVLVDQIIDSLGKVLELVPDAGQMIRSNIGDAFEYSMMRATTSTENFADTFIRELQAMGAAWAAAKFTDLLFGSRNERTGVRDGGWLDGLIDGKRAMGGPVSAGKRYLVGERGPELFVPKEAGSIVPNHHLANLRPPDFGEMRGSAPVVVQQHITLDARGSITTTEFVQSINGRLRAVHDQAVQTAQRSMPAYLKRNSALRG